MMKACGELGHEVSLATVVPPEPPAIEGAAIREYVRLTAPLDDERTATRCRARVCSTGSDRSGAWRITGSGRCARRRAGSSPTRSSSAAWTRCPTSPALENTIRVWYAADEWVLHHLSMLQFRRGHLLDNLKGAAMKGLYERAHRGVVDRVWVVTERDRRAMQRVAGMRDVDVLPNGVDADFFKPGPEAVEAEDGGLLGPAGFRPEHPGARMVLPARVAEGARRPRPTRDSRSSDFSRRLP